MQSQGPPASTVGANRTSLEVHKVCVKAGEDDKPAVEQTHFRARLILIPRALCSTEQESRCTKEWSSLISRDTIIFHQRWADPSFEAICVSGEALISAYAFPKWLCF